jgi:uncharacterized damage-inducible protein DinB
MAEEKSALIEQVVSAWRVNDRINFRLIENISDAGMRCTLSRRGGRNVVRQFAHLQYVRIYQLKSRAKQLAGGARVFDSKEEPNRVDLVKALQDSSQRIESWLRLAHEGAQGIRTFKGGIVPTVGYLIAHESHHRGSILLTLKQCGHPVERRVRDSIWDWNGLQGDDHAGF